MKSPELSGQIDPLHDAENIALSENSEKFIEDVVFKEIKNQKGEVIGYKSSSKDRKLIELPGDAKIEPGKPYKIRIKEDTKPDDPMSGKFVAEVVYDGQPLSKDEWNSVEGNVDQAEVSKRKSNAIRVDDLEFAPEFEENKNTERILGELGIEQLDDSDAGSIMAEKEAHDQAYKKLLGEEDSPERALVSLKWKNLSRAMKTEAALDQERGRVVEYETNIIKKILDKQDAGQSVSAERMMLNKAGEKERALDTADKKLRKSSPEAWYGLNLKELKRYKNELESGKIVETDYVRRQAEEVVEHVRAGQPVFIHGHLGSGKTELAFHTARKYFGKEALIISGSKHTSPAELYGHQILSLRDVDPEESEDRYKAFIKTATDEIDRWKRENNKATDKEIDQQFELIKSGLQERLAYEYRSGTVSDYFMGQVYQAMQEGRPIILDEVNAIPHDVLISLNHLLTRKVGDVIRIQQNSGSEVTIKEGFGFILTGNINEGGADKYVMRQDIDPAFLSRLHLMKHDYLPQAKEGGFDEAPLGDGKGNQNELFELMVSQVMDKNGNIEIPEGELRKLWNLAKVARSTEDNFAGGSVEKTQFFHQGGGTQPIEYRLKEGVLSIRGINKIITAWQNDGYRNELDHYVFSEFVNQPTKLSDKAYLYQLFKDQYGFFQKQNWDQKPNYGSKGIVSSFNISAPKNPAPKIEFMGPRQVVDAIYGKGPEREKWPDYRKKSSTVEKAAPEIDFTAKLAEFDKFKDESSVRINTVFDKIGTLAKGDPKRETAIKMYDEFMLMLPDFDRLSENAKELDDINITEKIKVQLEQKIKSLEDYMQV